MSHRYSRHDLIAALLRYRRTCRGQNDLIDRILSFVESTPQCAERTHLAGHLTASGWVINETKDKALLLHHAKLDKWLQLGGHADGEFDLLAVSLREVCEESGLSRVHPISAEIFDVDIHEIPAMGDVAPHLHFDVRFLLAADENEGIVRNHESKKIEWVLLSAVAEYTGEESVLRMARLAADLIATGS